jgi:hypothetical protein
MDNHKSAAERIRPILQAMERSIDSVRRSRVKDPMAAVGGSPIIASIPAPAAPAPAHPVSQSVAASPAPLAAPLAVGGGLQPPADPAAPVRLKARPKRIGSPFLSPFAQPALRSQAS